MERRRLLKHVTVASCFVVTGCLESSSGTSCAEGDETIREAYERLGTGGEGTINVAGEIANVNTELGSIMVSDGTGELVIVKSMGDFETNVMEGDCVTVTGEAYRDEGVDRISMGMDKEEAEIERKG
jgi:hypothetical protein